MKRLDNRGFFSRFSEGVSPDWKTDIGTAQAGDYIHVHDASGGVTGKLDASTLATTGWKLDDVIVVSQSGQGDYTTIAAGLAAATSGQLVLVDSGSYNEYDLTVGANVSLASIVRGGVTITAEDQGTNIMTLIGGNYLIGIYLTVVSGQTNLLTGILVSGYNVYIQNVRVDATNASSTGAMSGIKSTQGYGSGLNLQNVDLNVSGVAGGDSYSYYGSGSGGETHAWGGTWISAGSTAYAVNLASDHTIYFHGGTLLNSNDTTINSGVVVGHYTDISGDPDVRIASTTITFDIGGVSYQAGRIANGITRTVGSGKQHATIQDAINWFAATGKVLVGCYIDVDAGTYSEVAETANIGSFVSTGLTIRGDQRLLAGRTYIDGAPANQTATANGGTGTVSLSNSGSTITVAMTTTNPSFSGDGWGSGDRLYVRHNSGVAIYNISSTSGNVITLTTTAPAIGNDGTAVCLMPNRIVQSSGNVVRIDRSSMTFQGFDVYQTTGGASGLQVYNGSVAVINNCVVRGGYFGYFCSSVSYMTCTEGSAWANTAGFFSFSNAALFVTYGKSVSNTFGYYAQRFGTLETTTGSVGAGTTYGCYVEDHAYLYAIGVYARMNGVGTGFTAAVNGTMQAGTTSARANCATTYSPTGTPPFIAEASNFGVLYGT